MNIYEIISENFKKLTAVQLTLDGKGVVITGKNGVGKSSLIDALFTTLTGKGIPKNPIQKGKDIARNTVRIKQDDGSILTVEKSFKNSTTSLIVKTESGERYKSPQTFLNEIIGNITFDPFEFIQLQPIEQRNFLMKLLGLDFTEIDKRKRKLLDEKDDIYKEQIRIEKSIEKMPIHTFENGQNKKKDASDILKKQQEINELINKKKDINLEATKLNDKLNLLRVDVEEIGKSEKHYIEAISDEKEKCKNEIDNFKKQIEELNKKITAAETLSKQTITGLEDDLSKLPELLKETISEIEENQKVFDKLKAQYLSIIIPEFDGEKLLAEIEVHNHKIEENEKRSELVNELGKVETDKSEKLQEIYAVEDEKTKMINSVKMPVEGLAFTETGLTFEGMELSEEQISKAKLIEIGVKIQMALNPNLKIMRIKDGSLLDSEMLSVIKKSCKENDYQLFIEKVSDDNEIGFVIEEETRIKEETE